jgi:hypothetical protein
MQMQMEKISLRNNENKKKSFTEGNRKTCLGAYIKTSTPSKLSRGKRHQQFQDLHLRTRFSGHELSKRQTLFQA